MERNFEETINWHRLADELLDDMYECYGARWTAQWLGDCGFSIDEINYLLGTEYKEEEIF